MGKYLSFFLIILGFISVLILPSKVSAASSDIVINEVMVDPSCDHDKCEWLELYNNTGIPVNLKGWQVDAKEITTDIWITDYLVITKDIAEFVEVWTIPLDKLFQLNIALANNDYDTIILEDPLGNKEEISNELAGDNISWERIDPLISADNNWLESLILGGTPGAKNSVSEISKPESPFAVSPLSDTKIPYTETLDFTWDCVTQNVTFDFILSQNADLSLPLYEETGLSAKTFTAQDLVAGKYYWQIGATNILQTTYSPIYSFEILPEIYSEDLVINELYPDPLIGEEWFELYNTGAEDVNLKNWTLEDLKGSTHQYKISTDLIIPAGGYLKILKNQSGITLNNDQDGLRLIQPDGHVLYETPIFSAGDKGWSFALKPNETWAWTTTVTPEALNIIKVPVIEEVTDDEKAVEEEIPKNSDPIEIRTGTLKDYENYLVKITGRVVETSGNTFYLDDGTGSAKVYIQEKTGIDKPEMHTGDIFEIIGIVNIYRDVFRLLPRKQDDVKLVQALQKEDEEATSTVKKSSTASTSTTTKASTATVKARSPTKQVASLSTDQKTQVEGTKSSFLSQLAKVLTALGLVLLIIFIFKLRQIRRENPRLENFGDDET